MRKLISILLVFFFTGVSFGQSGTSGDPFTSLGLALTVPSAGVYHFNISGTTFSTYVDANGYVQVAVDFGNGGGNLPQGTSLTNTSRGILNTTALATLTSATEARVSSSSGNIDVTTSNATIISRVANNQTIHRGSSDNAINNSWTGTNSAWFTNNASCNTSHGNSLHQNLFHPCSNTNTIHWIPALSMQRERHASGDIAAANSITLWVRDNSSPLPIQLLNFNVKSIRQRAVILNWQTASETNNHFFNIERSIDGIAWETIAKIAGAGNSSHTINYEAYDNTPKNGLSYYRLKQTDFDGSYTYSEMKSIVISKSEKGTIYPNPTRGLVHMTFDDIPVNTVHIYNVMGQDVTKMTSISRSEGMIIIDLLSLPRDVYFIKTEEVTNKIVRQ